MSSDTPMPPSSVTPPDKAPPLKVVMADDHLILQGGIIAMLGQEPDMVCAGLAQNGDEALALVRREQPDVLVVDLSMPGLPVLTLLNTLRETMPAVRIVVLTMHATPFAMSEAFKAGAHAFMAKDDPFSVLISFIRRVSRGESGLHSKTLGEVIGAPKITSREREVLEGLSRGLSGKEIGDRLGISRKTMEMYRTRLLKKFNVDKATELVRVALESGVLRMTPAQHSTPPFTGGRTGHSP
ncbi:response regulator containing a CheY-like receiver domain and an HTH DNA-binding domain [Opitutaceae bacterium TAV1]|nr:response regulator containing a CheY-like receiver domain and an HTH DNA-binding domain [Opitutaceae bacterium TAV1]